MKLVLSVQRMSCPWTLLGEIYSRTKTLTHLEGIVWFKQKLVCNNNIGRHVNDYKNKAKALFISPVMCNTVQTLISGNTSSSMDASWHTPRHGGIVVAYNVLRHIWPQVLQLGFDLLNFSWLLQLGVSNGLTHDRSMVKLEIVQTKEVWQCYTDNLARSLQCVAGHYARIWLSKFCYKGQHIWL